MKNIRRALLGLLLAVAPLLVRADQTNIAEDDASQEAYKDGFQSGKSGGSGFGEWKMAHDGDGADRHAGFFIASTGSNPDLNGIAKTAKPGAFTPTAPASSRQWPSARSSSRSRWAIPFPS